LIAIRGDDSVQEEIVVVRDETPVTLQEQKIVDSYLDANETETFVFYVGSNTNFNISIDVLYGTINVTVRELKAGGSDVVIKSQIVSYGFVNIPIQKGAKMINLPTSLLNQ
jgi:hypothetical protein